MNDIRLICMTDVGNEDALDDVNIRVASIKCRYVHHTIGCDVQVQPAVASYNKVRQCIQFCQFC